MSAGYNFIRDTGVISVDSQDLLSDVQSEFVGVFGSNFDLNPAEPQGALIAAETIARTSVMKNNAELANMINPNYSRGPYLDSICAFLGISRGDDIPTVGTGVVITGDADKTIQAGSRVKTINGDVFLTANDVTIPSTRSTTVAVYSQQPGQIPLPVGQLTIIDGTIGWGAAQVTASTQVSLGALSLKDPQLKIARTRRLHRQGIGSVGAVISNLREVKNVTSATAVENNTGATGTVNGVQFTLPSGMFVCVAGAANKQDVANALYAAHSAGCPWDYGPAGQGVRVDSPNGTMVIDPYTKDPYYVKFTTPIMYDAYVYINVRQGTAAASVQAVQNLIIEYAKGQIDGEEGLVVGASVSAFEIAGVVSNNIPGIFVTQCQVAILPAGSAAPIYPTGFGLLQEIKPFEQATISLGAIQVVLS